MSLNPHSKKHLYNYGNLFKREFKQDFFGSAPAPFVGRFGYPNISVGILSPSEITQEAWKFDAPEYWSSQNMRIPEVLNYRSQLVNSKFTTTITNVRAFEPNRYLSMAQEIALSHKPVDVEINLEKAPHFFMNYGREILPMGPNASLKKMYMTENAKIQKPVEKVFSDTDMAAVQGLNYLYSKGYSTNFLSEILSVGTLGVKKNRKLVPTRWSITAVDDNICLNLLKEIKQDAINSKYCAYFGGYLSNYYLVLFFPDVFSYELFEVDLQSKKVWTDNEFYGGRKEYASNCVGGYYAARLAICEKLKQNKKQSSVLTLRFTTSEYDVPMGVWVVREATRKAMQSKPIEFASKELLLDFAQKFIKTKFGYDIAWIFKESKLMNYMSKQRKLFDFS